MFAWVKREERMNEKRWISESSFIWRCHFRSNEHCLSNVKVAQFLHYIFYYMLSFYLNLNNIRILNKCFTPAPINIIRFFWATQFSHPTFTQYSYKIHPPTHLYTNLGHIVSVSVRIALHCLLLSLSFASTLAFALLVCIIIIIADVDEKYIKNQQLYSVLLTNLIVLINSLALWFSDTSLIGKTLT